MGKDIPVTDIVCNIVNRDEGLEEKAADPGELNMQRERGESTFGKNTRRMAEVERMVTLQKKLVLRMVNGDEDVFLLPLPKNHV